MGRAQRSILLVGWDFNSRTRLIRDGRDEPGHRYELAAYLKHLVHENPRLRVRVLGWDFPVLYATEREMLPLVRFQLAAGPRLRFHLDGRHPVGASQHQKLAIVDDRVAFVGGIDLTVCRWDTPEHRPHDPRRSDPGFDDYAPFHDAQMLVDGAAGAAVAELARERWRRATGQRLAVKPGDGDPWPRGVEPHLNDVPVGIARTEPAFEGRAEVREVEVLYVRAIERARHLVYIENQYLTSDAIQRALARSLGRADGPEIVIVGPQNCSGWLEQQTMGILRQRIVQALRAADTHGRLTVVYPSMPGLPDGQVVNVHAKLMIVDDEVARIGSANLSNRSMGLDAECDLVVEAGGRADVAAAIRALRERLLAEHLGRPVAELAHELAQATSVGEVVARHEREDERCLRPLSVPDVEPALEHLGSLSFVDPERPVAFDQLEDALLPGDLVRPGGRRPLARLVATLVALVALTIVWRYTPVADIVTPARIAIAAEALRTDPGGPALMAVGMVVGSLVLVPMTVLVVATAFVFPPVTAFVVSVVATFASAMLGYGLGRSLWRDTVRRLAGRRLDRLNRELARRGAAAIAAARVFPLAPFTLVNLVAGASRITWRDFAFGTVVAVIPGVAVLVGVAGRVSLFLAAPGARALAAAVGAAFVAAGLTVVVRRALVRIAERRAVRDGD